MYGKFGQKQNKKKYIYTADPSVLLKTLHDETKIVTDLDLVGDSEDSHHKVRISFSDKDSVAVSAPGTNVVIAAFVTSYARLYLFKTLEQIGANCLYTDTDSIIYKWRPGQFQVPIGPFLGNFSSELPNNSFIVEFVSLGPKSYAYKRNDDVIVLKIKGITQSEATKSNLTLSALKKVLFSHFLTPAAADNNQPSQGQQQHNSVEQHIFTRSHVPAAFVTDAYVEKRWNFSFDKRRIIDTSNEEFNTEPFGSYFSRR